MFAFYSRLDRAICDGTVGMVKMQTHNEQITYASIVGGPTTEMVALLSSAMHNKVALRKIEECVYAYPSYSEILKQLI